MRYLVLVDETIGQVVADRAQLQFPVGQRLLGLCELGRARRHGAPQRQDPDAEKGERQCQHGGGFDGKLGVASVIGRFGQPFLAQFVHLRRRNRRHALVAFSSTLTPVLCSQSFHRSTSRPSSFPSALRNR